MSRLEKKCLVASTGMHAVLFLLLVFGTAFYVPARKQAVDVARVKVVPTKLIDQALSGGGGNPSLPPSDAMQKGNTLVPQPPAPPPPPPPVTPQPKQPSPPPQPLPETKKVEPAPTPTKRPTKTTAEPVKPAAKSTSSDSAPITLKPVVRTTADKEAAKAEAEAREWAAAGQRLSKQMGKAMSNLRAGFESGTVVEASGPGGEAYINYAAFVEQVYKDKWAKWLPRDNQIDDDATTKVSVTIARRGDVISAIVVRRSGNSLLDRSVENTLKDVKFVAPFPEGSREDQRVFTINFNLKPNRLTG